MLTKGGGYFKSYHQMLLNFNILNSVSLGNVHSMVLAYQWWQPKKTFLINDGNQKHIGNDKKFGNCLVW
jgi:hypothetical protein